MSVLGRRLLLLPRDLLGLSPVCRCKARSTGSLSEVGQLEALRLQGNYDTGQMFLHKVFGYRGVILFPWLARVYDRDMPNKPQTTRDRLLDTDSPTFTSSPSMATGGVGKEIKGRTHTYYQVLIDGRDSPYITHRAQTESVTFLGNHSENTKNLYAIPGLDYVAHEDILPYRTSETNPLQHELFDKFLMYSEGQEPPFQAQDTLRAWQEKNHPWLELSDVHKETTEDIRVTVIPFYMGFRQGWVLLIRILGQLRIISKSNSGRTSRTTCSGGDTASGRLSSLARTYVTRNRCVITIRTNPPMHIN